MPLINPSFEEGAPDAGEALGWAVTVFSSATEYATFEKSVAVVATTLDPATTTLGVELVLDPGGNIVYFLSAGVEEAAEDMEELWANNENYKFAYLPVHLDEALFGILIRFEAFEPGWDNDVGFLSNLGQVVTEAAAFDLVPEMFEDFAEGWPFGAAGVFIDEFPQLEMGTWNQSPGAYVDGAAYTPPEHATSVVATVTEEFTTVNAQDLTFNLLDRLGAVPASPFISIPRQTQVGYHLAVIVQNGVRDITSVVASFGVEPGAGQVKFRGDPGPSLAHAFFDV